MNSRIRHATFIVIFFWMALALIPQPPQLPAIGLDSSWAYALNIAHAEGLVFGKDVVFSFGPLGYLFYPVPKFTGPLLPFSLIWLIHGLFLFGMFLVWRFLGYRLTVLATWAVFSGAMLLTDLPFERMQLSFLSLAIGAVAWLVKEGDVNSLYLSLTGVFAGVMPLFKTNEGIAAYAVFYAILTSLFLASSKDLVTIRQKAWKIAWIPPAAFVVGYITVEHNISGIWHYVTLSLQIAMGYSEAMAFVGPTYQVLIGALSLIVLSVIIPVFAHNRRDLKPGYLPAVVGGFFAFKSAMVRQDPYHSGLLQVKLAVAALFLLICCKTVRDRWLPAGCVTASFCLGVAVFTHSFPALAQTARNRATGAYTKENLSSSLRFRSTWTTFASQTQQQFDRLTVDPHFAKIAVSGTVDDVPSELDIVPANGWHWKPRPVIQSYSAFTPQLDNLNAAHLAKPESADHILMQWDYIDGKQPLLDDAASWRALFDNYDVALARADMLLLNRRGKTRYSTPHRLGSIDTTWTKNIPVPALKASGFIMMRAAISKSLWGHFRGLLFRNSSTYVIATYASGKQVRWCVTRANLTNGAFIDLLPETLIETLPYFGKAKGAMPDPVESIRFETPGLIEFSPAIQISWYSVDFQPGEGQTTLDLPKLESLPRLHSETRGYVDSVDRRPCTAQAVDAPSNRPITISGWAVDEPAHQAASAVYIDVDGQIFPTFYGAARLDVATALKHPEYFRSGFTGTISAVPGGHRVTIRIINSAGTGYYEGPSFSLNAK